MPLFALASIFVLFFASLAVSAHPTVADGTASALGADDECGASSEGACALSALQLRAKTSTLWTPEASGGVAVYTAKCFSDTGGTCATEACDADRGAQCASGKCICQGGCTGADGNCHPEENKVVATNFVLANAKFEGYKMFFKRVTTFGQMSTTRLPSSFNMDQDKFDLYQLPGSDAGTKEFFLVSSKWSDYVLGFKATTGTALSPFAAYAVDLAKKVDQTVDVWGVSNIMLKICAVSPAEYAPTGGVRIGAVLPATDSTIWAYIHHGSWLVYGSMTKPGDDGIWFPDPPFPQGVLPVCS
mmetsp:Transcript_143889/g.460602  ORF Transcript_143889/g.460602 Transcript_143889/m.460602 type:complete len:301 (+) Transcript_143889:84-986(+)